jgi:hypothetical protein
LRVRIGLGGAAIVDKPGALIPPGEDNKGHPTLKATRTLSTVRQVAGAAAGAFVNGNIAATVTSDGMVEITRVSDGAVVLREASRVLTNNTVVTNSATANVSPRAPPPPTWYVVPTTRRVARICPVWQEHRCTSCKSVSAVSHHANHNTYTTRGVRYVVWLARNRPSSSRLQCASTHTHPPTHPPTPTHTHTHTHTHTRARAHTHTHIYR